jgi:hypothetical protein
MGMKSPADYKDRLIDDPTSKRSPWQTMRAGMTNLELDEALRMLGEFSKICREISVAAKLIGEHLDQLEGELLRRLILAELRE